MSDGPNVALPLPVAIAIRDYLQQRPLGEVYKGWQALNEAIGKAVAEGAEQNDIPTA
jgi:hypothetical protein